MEELTITLHYGGFFVNSGADTQYISGQSEEIKCVDPKLLSYIELLKIVRNYYETIDLCKLHYKISKNSINNGLRSLFDETSTSEMIVLLDLHKALDLYVEVFTVDENIEEGNHDEHVIVDEHVEREEDEIESSDDAFSDVGEQCNSENLESDVDDEEIREIKKKAKEFRQNMGKRDFQDNGEVTVMDENIVVGDGGVDSEYFEESEDGSFVDTSDDEGKDHTVKRKTRFVWFDDKAAIPHFEVGMCFESTKQFKAALINHSLKVHREIKLVKNDRSRVRAKCRNKGCPWVILLAYDNQVHHYQVKTFEQEHKCLPDLRNRMLTAKVLSKKYASIIKSNPHWKARDFKKEIRKDFMVDVTLNQCRSAKMLVLNENKEAYTKEYAKLWDYAFELRKSNPGSTIKIKSRIVAGQKNPIFERMYVCFDAVKKGFLSGCRKVLSIDGCYMRGPVKGQLLCAIGRDANNQIYPVAWAPVEVENKKVWSWFLKLLITDLGMDDGEGWTIISDQQKGLLPAIKELLPKVEHRMCARHIYANWSKLHKGDELKKKFWACAKASCIPLYQQKLTDMEMFKKEAAIDMLKTDPKHYCMAWFQTNTKCDSVENNMAESFNSWIIEARYKPICSMLEIIRRMVMVRIQEKKADAEKMQGKICRNQIKRLQNRIESCSDCDVVWNGQNSYEVDDGENRFVVDMVKRSCSCRVWELSGIPCIHAVGAIRYKKEELESYFSDCYSKESYARTYENCLNVVSGEICWSKTGLSPLDPPSTRTMPGRPKKKRIREETEKRSSTNVPGRKSTKISKKGKKMTCSMCHTTGHNKARCPLKNTIVEPQVMHSQTEQSLPVSATSIQQNTRKHIVSNLLVQSSMQCENMTTQTDSSKVKRPFQGYGVYCSERTGAAILNPGTTSQVLLKLPSKRNTSRRNDTNHLA